MKILEVTGKTVKDAYQNALMQLNVTENKVTYEVIDEGSKGFLGIGYKPAKIKVMVKKDYVSEARQFLQSILEIMKIEANIEIEEKENVLNIELEGKDMGIVIGYRGETLDSLQYLTSLVINKGSNDEYKRVILDTSNYRKNREESLRHLAYKTAKKVARTKTTIKLETMNPYERRIIHSALQNDRFVKTYSEGNEPHRRVVLELK